MKIENEESPFTNSCLFTLDRLPLLLLLYAETSSSIQYLSPCILHSWNIQYMYMNYTWTLHERTLIQFCPVSFSIILNLILSFCILFHHFESFSIILDPFPDLDLFPSFWIFFYHFRSFFRFVSFSIILDPFPSF